MPLQVHDVELVDKSNFKYTDRVIIGMQANLANNSSPGVISSVAVDAAGSYATLPTIGTSGNGSGATLVPHMKALATTVITTAGSGYAPGETVTFSGGTGTAPILTISTTKLVSAAVNAAGTGYAPTDTITLAGGAFTSAAILTVATTKVISKAVLTAGTGYAINDTITVAGGAGATKAIFTVTHAKLVSAAVNAAGTGYAPGDTITLSGGTGTPAVLTVNTVSSGAVATFTITTPGDYTVLSTTFTQSSSSGIGTGATFNTGLFGVLTLTVTNAGSYTTNATTFTQFSTSGTGTGATFDTIVYGVNTFTISTPGIYQTNASSFTQSATSGTGTGATFNTALYGLLSFTVSTPGDLTVLASNPVATTSNGSGTGITLTPLYGITSIGVSAGGTGYDSGSDIAVTGGGSTGGGEGTITLGSQTNNPVTVSVDFGSTADLSNNYSVFVNPQQACLWHIADTTKTASGFDVILTPLSGGTIAAGLIDVLVVS